MRSDNKNTLLFWKSKTDASHFGGSATLYSKIVADNIARISNQTIGSLFIYKTVTLPDEKLKLVMDAKSIEQFNPFSPRVTMHTNEIITAKL